MTRRTVPLAPCLASDLKVGDTARVRGLLQKAHTILSVTEIRPGVAGSGTIVVCGVASRRGTTGVNVSRVLLANDLVTVLT